jgi:hypothetical protein
MPASITSTYSSEFLETILVKLTTGNPTVSGGHIRIHSGVNHKISIPRISGSDLIKDYKATPEASDSGTVTITEEEILTGGYMLYARFNPETFANFWRPFQPVGSAFVFQELPQAVQMAIMEEFLRVHSEFIENLIFQGDTAGSAPNDKFDGALKVAAGDSDVIDVSTPISLTAGNIVAEIGRVYAAIPQAVKISPNCKIFVSYDDFELYGDAQRAKANKGLEDWDITPRSFKGKTIVPTYGMPKDSMLATVASSGMDSNLHMAIKFAQDFDQIKVGPVANDSEEMFLKMAFKAGIGYSFGSQVVAYNA